MKTFDEKLTKSKRAKLSNFSVVELKKTHGASSDGLGQFCWNLLKRSYWMIGT